jgi:hypothetical protein
VVYFKIHIANIKFIERERKNDKAERRRRKNKRDGER